MNKMLHERMCKKPLENKSNNSNEPTQPKEPTKQNKPTIQKLELKEEVKLN